MIKKSFKPLNIIIIIILSIILCIILYKIYNFRYLNFYENFDDNNLSLLLENPNENIEVIKINTDNNTNNIDKIPFNIFTCWHTKDMPPKMKENINKIKDENPEFNFYCFDNNECRDIIKKYFIKDVVNAYDALIPEAYKSDLWRYCILYLYGGIYQDIKFESINGFKYKDITDKEYFVQDREDFGIYNALLICKKNNKILEKSIKQIINNVKNKYYGINALSPTGPTLVRRFFNQDEFDNLEMKMVGDFSDNTDINIIFKDKKILKMYKGYRDEQKTHGKKEYYNLWNEKNIYKN